MKNHLAWSLSTLLAVALLSALCASATAAAVYPLKPLRIIVPTAPGGGVDILARLLGHQLMEAWGEPVVVDNRPGAGGNIGTETAARSAPDGYTLLMVPSSFTISPSVYKDLRYDAVRDFAPVTIMASTPYALFVHPKLPAHSVEELIAYAKGHPGKLDYGSAGRGTASDLAGALFESMAHIEMTNIPYKGLGPAVNALLAGEVRVLIGGLPAALPHVLAGRLRVLGLASAKRSTLMPELPTIAESGVPGYEVQNWVGLLAPAGVSSGVVNALHQQAVQMLAQPQIKKQLIAQGFEPVGNEPGEFAAEIKLEIAKWARVVKKAGIAAG